MTQVLETMMERQRLEMNRRLNEMFKTYFDARANMENKEDEQIDDELNLLREAAMQSTNENNDNDGQKFQSFHQFKEYKAKMREKGLDNEFLIVSIPNINAENTST